MKNLDLYADLVGTKFKMNGRGPTEYDCYGLAIEIQKRRGYFLPEVETPASIDMRMKMFDKVSSEYCDCLERPEPFCVVVFDAGRLSRLHMGIVLPDCRNFIHAAIVGRVRITRLNGILWKHRIYGFYRCIKELENVG